jgi:hypothetical protein
MNITLLESMTGTKFTAVHYAAQLRHSVTDRWPHQSYVASVSRTAPHIGQGRSKLGVGSAKREACADLPTIAESASLATKR